jgi:DNA replication protein DnaC
MRDRIDSDITERQIVLDLVAPDILGISDVLPPSGPLTPYQAQTVMQIVDARYRQKRSTWCTLNVETGAQAAERMGLAVVDRLREGALVVNFDWESYRTRKQY